MHQTKSLIFKTTASSNHWIDLAKELSKLNRQSFSQGRMYEVSSIEVHAPANLQDGDSVEASVSALQCTWVTRNAFVKAKKAWQRMNRLVLKDSPSVKPKYHDFKVYFDRDYDGTSIGCVDALGNALPSGDWSYSRFVMPSNTVDPANGFPTDALENYISMNGNPIPATPTFHGTINAIQAYASARATVDDDSPNVDSAFHNNFYSQLTDMSSHEDDIANNLENRGDSPPYNVDSYIGDPNSMGSARTLIGKRTLNPHHPDIRFGSFCAPCGHIGITINRNIQSDNSGNPLEAVWIRVNLKSGKYKGVLAPSMEA